MDFYHAYKEHLDKDHILQSNKSLQEKLKSLSDIGADYTLQEILDSHPYDWSYEDEVTRRAWSYIVKHKV